MKSSQRLQQTFGYFPQEFLSLSNQKQNNSIASNAKNIYQEDQLTKLQNMLIKKPSFEEMMLLKKQIKQLQKIIVVYKEQQIQSKKEREQLKQKLKTSENQKEIYRLKNKELQIQVNKFDEIRSNIVEEYRTIKSTLFELNKKLQQKHNQCEKLRKKTKQYEKNGELKDQNCQLKRIQAKQANQIQVLKKVILQLRSQIKDIKVQMFQRFVVDKKIKQFQAVSEQENIYHLQSNKQNCDQNSFQTKKQIKKNQNKNNNDKQKKSRAISLKKGNNQNERTRASSFFR